MKRTHLIAALALVIAGSAIGWGYSLFVQQKQKDVIYLALVGPLADPARGAAMRNGVQMYLDEIDSTVNGKQIQVIEYDDENKLDLAEQKALEIAQDPRNPLIVLGHRGSDQSARGGAVYKQYQIPAITASAPSPTVTKDNEWYFSAIIENTSQGHFIAQYAKDVLGYNDISVVYVDNDYGRTLGEAVLDQAGSLDIHVAYQNAYKDSSDKQERWDRLPGIVDELFQIEEPGLIILAVGDEDGARLVRAIREKGWKLPASHSKHELPILEALITQTFDNDIRTLTDGQQASYLQNVWTTQHLIYDTGNKLAQNFEERYQRKYGMKPDAAAAAYYDAAMLALKAIQTTESDGTNTAQNREKIRSYLSGLTKLDPAIRGTTGYLYFNEHRNAVKPVPIGIYDNGLLVSAPIQLKAIPNIELIRDLPGDVRQGNIIEIDNNYFYKTQVVYTGIDLNEISNLDVKNSTFTADFYIWFRYLGTLDESKIEFVNAAAPVQLGNPVAQDTFNGQTYHAYRVKADFKSDFDFRAYPFDQQTLNIIIRDRDLPREQLTFVLDERRLLDSDTLRAQLNQASIGGWEVIGVNVYSDILRSDSTLGNPRFNNAGVEYSIFNVDTVIQRNAVNFSIKNLFPIFAVLVLAYLAFFIPAGEFGMRVSLGINAIMTTAFFSLKISSDLPSIGYLVALEYIFFMTYTLALVVIVLAILIYIADKRSNEGLIRRFYWAGRILFPAAIGATAYLIMAIIRSAP